MARADKNSVLTDEEKEYYSLTESIFSRLAPFYDPLTFFMSGVRKKAVDFANAPTGSKVLDAATGTGKQAFAFAARGHDVTGVDISEAMLRVALRKNKFQNARFLLADATALPFPDESFDVASVSFALHDMPRSIREKTLKEMARVTRPGGIILIIDHALPRNKLGRFLAYHFTRLHEAQYYREFIRSGPAPFLAQAGLRLEAEKPAMCATAKIYRIKK